MLISPQARARCAPRERRRTAAYAAFLAVAALQYWACYWGAWPGGLLVAWHTAAACLAGGWAYVVLGWPGLTPLGRACILAAGWAPLPPAARGLALAAFDLDWPSLCRWLIIGLPAAAFIAAAYSPRRRAICLRDASARSFIEELFAPAPRKGRVRRTVFALAGFAALSCAMTYPGVARARTHIMGAGGDPWQMAWNLWWFREAVFVRHVSPYWTGLLFHPTGASLICHSFEPFNGLLASPLQPLLGSAGAYNAIFFFNFVASGFAMYLLALALTGHAAAAFVAGCAFTFSAPHMLQSVEHQNVASLEWLPIYCLALLKTHVRRGLGWPILAGVAAVCSAACSWYLLLFELLFTAATYAFLVGLDAPGLGWFRWLRRGIRTPSAWRPPAVAAFAVSLLAAGLSMALVGAYVWTARLAALAALLWMPLYIVAAFGWPCLGRLACIGLIAGLALAPPGLLLAASRAQFEPGPNPGMSSTDVASFFAPGSLSTYDHAFEPIWRRFRGFRTENQSYLGWAVLLPAAALWFGRGRRKAAYWTLIAAVFAVLSCGPVIRVAGVPVCPGPYNVLRRAAPFLGVAGNPGRMAIMASLAAIAMLAATLARVGEGRERGALACAGVGVLVLAEALCIPFPTALVVKPAFCAAMAGDGEDYAIIDTEFAVGMYRQTLHGKKMMGGYLARRPDEAMRLIRSRPIFRELLDLPLFRAGQLHASPQDIAVLRRFGVRYIIDPTGLYRRAFVEQLGLRMAFHEGAMCVYEVAP